MEEDDLRGYLIETILVPRYLKSARETPEFYESIENYKSSLYVACWKACLAHYRRITAQKRADYFRAGAAVMIDQPDDDGALPRYEMHALFKPSASIDMTIKAIADDLHRRGHCMVARLFLCCAILGWKPKDFDNFGITKEQRERYLVIMRTSMLTP